MVKILRFAGKHCIFRPPFAARGGGRQYEYPMHKGIHQGVGVVFGPSVSPYAHLCLRPPPKLSKFKIKP